jgi:hypothetical protein
MRNIADKVYRKPNPTYYAQNLLPENRAVYEIMWKNMEQPGRPQVSI